MASPANTQTLLEIDKAPDLKAHVRVVEVAGVKVVEVRDFIPSLGEYGRGYWWPIAQVDALMACLAKVKA